MSDILNHAIAALSKRLGDGFDGTAKFTITGEGHIMVDDQGVREGDEDADVTMIASAETFQGIMEGDVNPTMAFMTGKLKIEGNMGMAMKLGSALSG
ncbi:MAG: sterol carrier family protein [Rhodobacteraceae bacterium]|nr:MAG: sterol carrier family protein [Paracoccaceae bacterium]